MARRSVREKFRFAVRVEGFGGLRTRRSKVTIVVVWRVTIAITT